MAAPTRTFIRSYGLFWLRDEVDWNPGSGNAKRFRLLGRRGANRGTLRIADFRDQRGIYILYDDYGPYYVGLAERQGLGDRLKQHTTDGHKDKWDRFSWFGFRRVLKTGASEGLSDLSTMPRSLLSGTTDTIRDIEALLMTSLGTTRTGNKQSAKFRNADEWEQIWSVEEEKYLKGV